MKIYTKTGDKGETGVLGGVRVQKNHAVIESCGAIDEVNSILGLVRAGKIETRLNDTLLQVQNDLFDLGGRVAGCLGESARIPGFSNSRVEFLEKEIDELQDELPPLTQFILPDGGESGCRLHLARSVCRRAERCVVSLRENETTLTLETELVYLNRLSDFLFVAARWENLKSDHKETPWKVTEAD